MIDNRQPRSSCAAIVLTVSTLVALAAPRPAPAASLVEVTSFGSNPTGLRMHLYVPDSVAARPAVLVAAHPCGGSGPQFYSSSEFAAQADRYGFIVIYPSARTGTGGSNCFDVHSAGALKHDGNSDPVSVVSMVRYVLQNHAGDPARVFATGSSSGAMFTNVLLGDYPDVFAAGAAFMGVPFSCMSGMDPNGFVNDCSSGRLNKTPQQWGDLVRAAYPGYTGARPRMQLWHGTADSVLNYANFAEEIDQWTNVLGVSQTPSLTDAPRSGWTRTRYGGTGVTPPVEAISIQGAGHALPQAGQAAMAIAFFGLDAAGTTYTLTVAKAGTGTGTVTSSVGGINCGSTCSATLASGTAVTLTAAAASGSTFAGFGGACAGTGTCVVTMTAAQSVTATFTSGTGTTFPLTVTKSGAGTGTVTSSAGGINCGSTCSATLASGTSVTLTATALTGSSFGGWSGACVGTGTCVVTMTAAQSVTATFGQIAGGPVSVNAGGSAAGAFLADAYFSGGSTYSNTRTIDTSLLSGTVPPQAVFQTERYGEFTYTIPMSASPGSPYTVTLYFAETYWTAAGQRTFNVAVNGAAVLTAFDIFAAAGAANRAVARTFDTTSNANGQVVIQFTRGGGQDNPKICGISVAAGAGGTTYPLTVSKTGTGSGTVTGAGISCGATCSAELPGGTSVTLTAAAASGSTFAGWSGACTGTSATCSVSMTAARTVTASFTGPVNDISLTVTKAGTGSGTVSASSGGINCGSTCSAIYASGAVVTLTAAAASGSTFGGWGGACTGTSATCTVTMTASRTVTATFNPTGSTCKTPASSGQSGNFDTTGAVCYTVNATIRGWGCSNVDGRTASVNGTAVTCGQMPLPGSAPYTFSFTAGAYPWASFYWW